MKKGLIIAIVVAGLLVMWGAGKYNSFVKMQENVQAKWSQVENTYQRRSDLIPNLVQTVKGYAAHEQETFTAVTEARSNALQVKIDPSNITAEDIEKFQSTQSGLNSALSRLLAISENYPELKADKSFLELQAQLEGTENRIAVAREDFNNAAKEYNTSIRQFPANIIASICNFDQQAYFKAEEGASKVPQVDFSK